jgi:hypothetical protein
MKGPTLKANSRGVFKKKMVASLDGQGSGGSNGSRSIFTRKIVQGKSETTIEQTSKDFEEYGSYEIGKGVRT